jgi:hypothetical protein
MSQNKEKNYTIYKDKNKMLFEKTILASRKNRLIKLSRQISNEIIRLKAQNDEGTNSEEDNINQLMTEALNIDLEKASPSFRKNPITDAQIMCIIENLQTKFKNATKATIYTGIILLFLKGAATKSTPGSLTVEIFDIKITKADLENSAKFILTNTHLRRLAEKLAVNIGSFAEEKGLEGELAGRINFLINNNNRDIRGEKEPLLTPKEKAWCSSFSMVIPDLNKRAASNRLTEWLSYDYEVRFNQKSDTKKNNK